MCRLGIAILLLGLTAFSVSAQDAARWRDEAQKAQAEYRALRDSMVQGDSTVREVARSGDLVVAASENLRRIAQVAFDRITQNRKRWFEGGFPSGAGFRIVIREQADFDPTRPAAIVVLSGLPDGEGAPRLDRSVPRHQIAESLIDIYGEMMIGALPPFIGEWLGGPIPLSLPEAERKHLAMYALATGNGTSQRACLSGSVPDCLYALGLGSPPREQPGGAYTGYLRGDLLLNALELQPDSWERLRRSTSSDPLAAVSAATGISPDSLIHRWLSATLTWRPSTGLLGTSVALSALAWIGLILVGALFGGKSRWV